MGKQGDHGITWTERTWNPIRGCRRISGECRNCYAERVAARFSAKGQPYHGLARFIGAEPHWTGAIRVVADHLLDPLRWQKPGLVFVNSMSDFFYEDLTDTQIDRMAAVMLLAKRQTFQVLTKRVDRMADWLTAPGRAAAVATAASQLVFDIETGRNGVQRLGHVEQFGATWDADRGDGGGPVIRVPMIWPLPNVWWGFSAGRQATFDAAMPHIVRMQSQAAICWWSAEPLLEPIDTGQSGTVDDHLAMLDWVVVGGESQAGCRPMNPDWARWIQHQAKRAGTAFHMKQLGGHPNPRKKLDDLPPDLRVRDYPTITERTTA